MFLLCSILFTTLISVSFVTSHGLPLADFQVGAYDENLRNISDTFTNLEGNLTITLWNYESDSTQDIDLVEVFADRMIHSNA
jgi:hypothetical protein